MHIINYILYIGVVLLLCSACTEDIPGPLSDAGSQPDQVSNVTVESRPGGAKLRYQVPDNEDLLYVKAVYEFPKGNFREVRASMYVDTLIIEGIGNTEVRPVSIYAVSRSEKVSEPVVVDILPETPPVETVAASLEANATFGGLTVFYDNVLRYSIVIEVMKKVAGEWIIIDSHYTNNNSGLFAVRGQAAEPAEFGIFVRDRWSNRSDTVVSELTPLYEIQLPAPTWLNSLASDYNQFYLNNHYGRMFDGITTPGNYAGTLLSSPASDLPSSFSLDFGAPVTFSRFKYWMPQSDQYGTFSYASPEKWQLWGTNTLADDWEQWTLISEYTAVKPSGAPTGTLTDLDRQTAYAGLDFDFPIGTPPYRYIRWRTTKNFGSLSAVQITELAFFGTNE